MALKIGKVAIAAIDFIFIFCGIGGAMVTVYNFVTGVLLTWPVSCQIRAR